MEIIDKLLDHLGIFLLIFARIVGMFVTAPILNLNHIPAYIKLGFSLFLTFILFPMMDIPAGLQVDSFYALVAFAAKEFLTGMIIGFICYLFFSIVYLAGHMIDMEIGFSIANVINPMDENEEIALTANLFFIMAVLIFLSIDGHHLLIQAMKQSFDMVPMGKFSVNVWMVDQLIGICITIFVIAFKFSAPIVVSIFLTNVLLGILARTMPQMNVFVVGMPLKILLGLLVLFIIMPLYVGFFEYVFDRMFENLKDFLNAMGKG